MVGQEQQQQQQQKHMYQEMGFKNNEVHVQWVIMESQNQNGTSESESMSSIGEDSGNNSAASTSSSELEEDASSSAEFGPLYELSDLMNQLPIKRGLSENYQGKSQSFTSLANVKSLEDLAKKSGPYSQRMKSCKSYAAGLDGHNHKYGPKATIAKKRGSSSSSFGSFKGNLAGSFRRPVGLRQRDF